MMRKLALFSVLLGIVFLVLSFSFAFAVSSNPANSNGNSFNLPENAVKVSDNVYFLGEKNLNGNKVEGYAVVHYKKGYVHNPSANINHAKSPSSSCYAFIATGAKWKFLENFLVNTNNTEGLNSSFIVDNLNADLNAWESAAGKNITGNVNATSNLLVADTVLPDTQNEVYFGSIDEADVIAVNIVWGIFSGPAPNREIIESDLIFDQVDFNWTSDAVVEPGKIDFWNIAIHELGHTMGLADLYTLTCTEETMFGFSSEGEIKKRSLNTGDITGVKKLYK